MARKEINARVEITGGAGDLLAQAPAPRDLGVPEGPDEVTPGWLTEALRRTGPTAGVAVVGFDAEPLTGGRGFLGQTIRFRLRLAGEPRVRRPRWSPSSLPRTRSCGLTWPAAARRARPGSTPTWPAGRDCARRDATTARWTRRAGGACFSWRT